MQRLNIKPISHPSKFALPAIRRLASIAILLTLMVSILSACQFQVGPAARTAESSASIAPDDIPSTDSATWNASKPYVFTDALGSKVTLSTRPKRVAALMGSFAETWTLAGGDLVGVTSDAKTERGLSLADTVATVGSVKDPSLEQLLALAPDFVILSADIEGHRKIDQQLKDLGIPRAYFKVEYFADYLDMLRLFTEITGKPEQFQQNGLAVQNRIQSLLTSLMPPDKPTSPALRKPKILLIRTFSTGAKALKAATMTGRMLADLGTDNIADRQPSLLEELSMEAIIAEDPDFIFVVTMGESSEKALSTLKEGIEKNPAWNQLAAIKNNRYIVLPKELYHYKPNARWDEAYATLAIILAS